MKKLLAVIAMLLTAAPLGAATPPDRINYQGVLRDASGTPLTGSYDMVLRLFDESGGGNEVLVDRHLAADGFPVEVAGGLFNVEIGSGQVLDGAGPGTFTSLGSAFGSHGELWLAIEIGGEPLAPRLHLAAAGYALNAANLAGRAAGEFLDTSATGQTKSGPLTLDASALPLDAVAFTATGPGGPSAGAGASNAALWFSNGQPGNAAAGSLGTTPESYWGAWGIRAYGQSGGAWFSDSAFTSDTTLASGGYGITAGGPTAGGRFFSGVYPVSVLLAQPRLGVHAALSASAEPSAISTAGRFEVRDQFGFNVLARARIAEAWTYCCSPGLNPDAAVFENLARDASVVLGHNSGVGVVAETALGPAGVFFSTGGGGIGWSYEDVGVVGEGNKAGGRFLDGDSSAAAYVGYGTYKIQGTGSVAFVQNHPQEEDRVIVYNAPEGGEVATYTRGSARLSGGEARIPLDPTFAWVTNPDLGLTAYVTPIGEWADLYVAEKTTEELVVRSRDPQASPVEFDYMVYGLRIGFEETSIVQEKVHEAFIPSMAEHRRRYEDHPELRRFSALERVKTERARLGLEAAPDLGASKALREAIHEYDAAADRERLAAGRVRFDGAPGDADDAAAEGRRSAAAGAPSERRTPSDPASARPGSAPGEAPRDAAGPAAGALAEMLLVSEPVRAGELLAIDPLEPERVRRAEGAGDAGFVGVAAADSIGDAVALATTRIVRVRVDASYGAIAVGDLLTTSPSAGLAMRAGAPAPGTVFGKALDALEWGAGEIRVLWMPR